MAGPHSINPHELDGEVAAALRVKPSGEFRARIRARVAGEKMNVGWQLPQPAIAYAGTASVVVAGAIWFLAYGVTPVIDKTASTRSPVTAAETVPTEETARHMMASRDAGRRPRHTAVAAVMPRRTGSAPVAANEPAAAATVTEASSAPEVLLSESERAGVQLLFESAASGRLRLPEEMLRDLSLPIVEARTTFPDPDLPWVTVEGAVQ